MQISCSRGSEAMHLSGLSAHLLHTGRSMKPRNSQLSGAGSLMPDQHTDKPVTCPFPGSNPIYLIQVGSGAGVFPLHR